jgi:hypothetical protein
VEYGVNANPKPRGSLEKITCFELLVFFLD